jgi:toxin ParE1/3/4
VPIRTVTLHQQAADDYDAAFDWYLERSRAAAIRFDAAVEHAFIEVAENPDRWPRGSYGTRRFLLRGFPYLIIYRESGPNAIQILAIAHTSRQPGYWRERV